jgi:hypothetical protein
MVVGCRCLQRLQEQYRWPGLYKGIRIVGREISVTFCKRPWDAVVRQ